MEGNNKFNTGKRILSSEFDGYKTVDIGRVVQVEDPQGLGRIKVVINGPTSSGGDNGVAFEDLSWCFPMIPKFFTSQPKVGESVFILTLGNDSKHSDRMYLGPIISQPQLLNYDSKAASGLAGFGFSNFDPDVNIDRIPEMRGVFPKPEDIAIQGRYNTDLIFKNNEVLMRAGKFIESDPSPNNPFNFQFNTKTQGYVQIKNDVVLNRDLQTNVENKGSVTNIVANKINLLTHKDGNPRFNLTNQEDLINIEEMDKILQTAHPLGFGDITLQYLRLLKNAFLTHVHNGNGKPPTDLTAGGSNQYVKDFVKNADDLEKQMLSQNIKIN